jgi:NAD(P)H-quinone oxidoreductase subunit 6
MDLPIPLETQLFFLLATIAILSAALVVFSPNIIHSGFALLGAFGGVAGLYIFLSADFVAVVQILVYIGGILVLILFSVMLTNRIRNIAISNQSINRWLSIPVGAALAGLLAYVARYPSGRDAAGLDRHPWNVIPNADNSMLGRLGDAFLDEYLMPFELASVVILVALIGAAYIARREVRGD